MARIGLLEDNSRIAKLCAIMLTYADHEVTIYPDAIECLHALTLPNRTSPGPDKMEGCCPLPIDVLILDLHLPTLSGQDVLRLLRNNARTSRLPLIFCTAAPLSELQRVLDFAPDAVLVEKPFKLQALVSAINQVLTAHPQ